MKKIAILRSTSGIGDILMISPIVKELSLINNVKIDFYTNLSYLSEIEVLNKNPFIKRVFDIEKYNHKIYDYSYDLSYVAYAYEQSGCSFSRQEIFAKYCKVIPRNYLPVYNNNLKFSYEKKTIAIHTEAAEERRSWPQSYTDFLIKWIIENTSCNLIYLNQKPLKIKSQRIRNCSNSNLKECVEFLSGANLLISVDSCFMHFSAMLKIKSLVLFGSTKPDLRLKHYSTHESIYTPTKCKGCFYKECNNYICMKEIKPDQVIKKIKNYAFLF
jgi:ADP-heptose:LPS heptosyltransferase